MKIIKQQILLLVMAVAQLSCTDTNDTELELPSEINYTNPVEISVNGFTDHMMEPFISPDGNTLFFNNINSGGNTRLFYATKLTNTTFEFKGEVEGANEDNQNQLNAVADMDIQGNFYWTSVRNFPTQLDNLHFGSYANGTLTNVGRVQGDFYVGQPNWLVMDHGISPDGQTLYFNNARFDDCGSAPCETVIGMAKKTGTGSFQKIANSDAILATINDPTYIYYAPCITQDQLELYYTRFKSGTVTANTLSEICVATRSTINDPFGIPKVLFASTLSDGIVEASTLTTDKQHMYYHKKVDGVHKLLMRTRE